MTEREENLLLEIASLKARVAKLESDNLLRQPKHRGRPRKERREMKVFMDHLSRTFYGGFSVRAADKELAERLGYGGDGSRSVRRNRRLSAREIEVGSIILAAQAETMNGEPTRLVFLFDSRLTIGESPAQYTVRGNGWYWDEITNNADYGSWILSFPPADVGWESLKKLAIQSRMGGDTKLKSFIALFSGAF